MFFRSIEEKLWVVVASCAALMLIAVTPALSAWISTGGAEGAPVEVRLLESAPDRVVIEYSLPGFDAEPVTIDGRTYYAISLPGEGSLLQSGLPELPHVARSIIIPDAARMRARILGVETTDFAGMPVVPSKGNLLRTVDPATVAYSFDPFYGTPAEFPESRVATGEPYILRDYRGLVVDAFPITATGDGTVRAATRLTIEVFADGYDEINVIQRSGPPEKVVPEFGEIYRHRFLNYGMDRYTPVPEQGEMLIITHDAFHSAMQPLVDWKVQSGMPTTIVDISTIGNTSTAIKSYIQTTYNQGGLAFVLLVGDAAQIATPSAAGGASDPTYSLLAGSDRYPEILVGRFSAETVAQVQTQVQRTIGYEQTPAAGAAWYQKGTGIASNQGPGDDGEYDYQHMNVIRGKLLAYGYALVDQIYDPSATAAMVSTALNSGRSIVNYTGHGSMTAWSTTGFSNSNVTALQNDWMLPFIFSVACVNGQFDAGTCFGEAWLRSVHNGNPIGAIGAYMSSINQSWNPPMCAQDECNDLLVNDEMFTYGGLCFNGSCQMMDEYGANDGGNMFLTWHVFGDPSVLVRTKMPEEMAVQHNGAMVIGESTYAVSVPGVTGARCALYGDGVLYGTAYTDGAGAATITLSPLPAVPTTLSLTVTAFNRIPVIDPVEIAPAAGAYLVYLGGQLDDLSGDADGQCDAGETVGLSVTLRNVGADPTTTATAVLSTADPFVSLDPGVTSLAGLPPDSSGSTDVPFGITISGAVPDQHVIPFTLQVTSPEGSWSFDFSFIAQAPVLLAGAPIPNEAPPLGDGDGIIDPGESILLQLAMTNTGHGDALDLAGTLSCDDPYIVVTQAQGTCEQVPADGDGLIGTFELQVLPGCPTPAMPVLHLALSGPGGFEVDMQWQINVGPWFDDAETDRGWTLGAPGDNATAGQWVRADPVGTVYNGQQSQPELDHSPEPGSLCFVTANGAVGAIVGDADVDGGKTTLLSPVFNAAEATGATISYWRWFTNNLGVNLGLDDYWTVEVTADGTNWVQLEHTIANSNAWTYHSFDLDGLVPLTSTLQFRFVAQDQGPGGLVEAAVDDITISILRQPTTGVSAEPAIGTVSGIVSCRPNPLQQGAQVTYRLGGHEPVRLELYDTAGRRVRTLFAGAGAPGEHALSFPAVDHAGRSLPSGIYFIRMATPEKTEVRQITVLR